MARAGVPHAAAPRTARAAPRPLTLAPRAPAGAASFPPPTSRAPIVGFPHLHTLGPAPIPGVTAAAANAAVASQAAAVAATSGGGGGGGSPDDGGAADASADDGSSDGSGDASADGSNDSNALATTSAPLTMTPARPRWLYVVGALGLLGAAFAGWWFFLREDG